MWQKQLTNIEVAGSQSGFPKKPFSPLMSNLFSVSSMNMLKTIYQRCVMRMKVNAMDVSMRLGDAIDPCHLANGFEAVIGYECQERSIPLSLTPTIQTIHAICDKVSEWVGGSLQCRRGLLGILWMSLVDVAVETYDGPTWRLISTLCGESATRSFVRCSSIQVPELSDSDSYSGPPQPFITESITRSPEDL